MWFVDVPWMPSAMFIKDWSGFILSIFLIELG